MVVLELIDKKVAAILRTLHSEKEKLFHLHQLASISRVSAATTLRIVRRLVSEGYISVVTVGKLKLYKVGANEEMTGLIEAKRARILHALRAGTLFHLHQLAGAARVPGATTLRIVRKLVELGYVEIVRVGKLKLYRLAGNESTQEMKL